MVVAAASRELRGRLGQGGGSVEAIAAWVAHVRKFAGAELGTASGWVHASGSGACRALGRLDGVSRAVT